MRYLKMFLLLVVVCPFKIPAQNFSIATVIKKGKEPVVREHMSDYNPTGFYLYENCLYNFQLKKGKVQTARLISVKPDTLVFKAPGEYVEFNVKADSIQYFYISDHWTPNATKKVKMKNHQLLFTPSSKRNFIPGKSAYVFPDMKEKYELIPSPTKERIVYFFYYEGQLFYHSGEEIDPPKYSQEEREKVQELILTALDILVNQRVDIVIQK